MADYDKYLTLAELCSYLGISRSLGYKLSHRCAIPKFKPTNGKLLFKKSEIDEWVDTGRIKSEEEVSIKAKSLKS
jgi:excisionase family DNA binding protein